MTVHFEVFWRDCEGKEGWTSCESRGEAEQFAQWCHELGDTDIRVEKVDDRKRAVVWEIKNENFVHPSMSTWINVERLGD